MENNPLVSVVIPVYKTEQYLKKCVESVLNQSYLNIDIILVDDGSPDSCPAICDELAKKHSRIQAVHKENGGLSSARNAGIDAADKNSEYLLFLDSDDTLIIDAVSGLVKTAVQTNSQAVYPDRYVKVFEKSGKSKLCRHFSQSMYRTDPIDFALDVIIEQGRAWRASSVLYRYDFVVSNKVRFPEGKISEDICFNLEFLSYADKISFYSKPTLNNLKRDGSITSSYQPNFEKDIWYIDSVARQFLERTKKDDKVSAEKADALLCRNLIIYLFSIFSRKNPMEYQEKVEKANSIINDKNSRSVVRYKHKTPYFEEFKKRFAVKLIYFFVRTNNEKIAYRILSII